MNAQRLKSILSCFPNVTICVVGDFFLDRYLIIDHALREVSLETGLEAHQVVRVQSTPGAAGNVAANLRAMEVNVIALGVIGKDGEGYELRQNLEAMGVDASGLLEQRDRFTPTYMKLMLREQDESARELNRLDLKNRTPMPSEIENEIVVRLRQIVPRVHGVIIADQVPEHNCGVITDRVRQEIAALAHAYPNTFFIADSRERIGLFRGVMIKPNMREATRAIYPDRDAELDCAGVQACGEELYRRNGLPVFLTMGVQGITVFDDSGPKRVPAYSVPGLIDIVGAGDWTIAGIAATLCSGAKPQEAAAIGNLAAAVTIQQVGTTGTASREQIAKSFTSLQQTPSVQLLESRSSHTGQRFD